MIFQNAMQLIDRCTRENNFSICSIFVFIIFLLFLIPKSIHEGNDKGMFIYYEINETKLFDENFNWLLISLFVSIPVLIDLVLDLKFFINSRSKNWLNRSFIFIWVFIPNLLMLLLCNMDLTKQNSGRKNNILLIFATSLYLTQPIAITTHMFMTLMNSPNLAPNPSIIFKTMPFFFLFSFALSQLIFIFRALLYQVSLVSNIFNYLGIILIFASVAQMFYLSIRYVFKFSQKINFGRFNSHHEMSDFFISIASLVYISVMLATFVFCNIFEKENILSISYISVQIALMYFLTILPSRKHRLSSELKKEKLEHRLSMIRYLSHEMRTPLNTSMIGLNIIERDLNKIMKDYHATIQMIDHHCSSANKPKLEEKTDPNQFNVEKAVEGLLQPLLKSLSPTTSVSHENLSDDASSKISSFLSIQSHSTHLYNSIKNIVEKSLKKKYEIVETVLQIIESCNVALATLDDLLTYDKLDEKKLEIFTEDLDPFDLIFQSIKPFELNAKQSDLVYTISINKSESINVSELNSSFYLNSGVIDEFKDFCVHADKYKFGQIIRNLVSNAMKFSPAQSNVHIGIEKVPKPQKTWIRSKKDKDIHSVSTRSLSINQSSSNSSIGSSNQLGSPKSPNRRKQYEEELIRISISDSGPGISLENQKKLFGQYVQFNSNTLQQGKGSGLGLWISKRLVEMHNGQIGVKSEGEGKGATFFIEIPLKRKSSFREDNVRSLPSNYSPQKKLFKTINELEQSFRMSIKNDNNFKSGSTKTTNHLGLTNLFNSMQSILSFGSFMSNSGFSFYLSTPKISPSSDSAVENFSSFDIESNIPLTSQSNKQKPEMKGSLKHSDQVELPQTLNLPSENFKPPIPTKRSSIYSTSSLYSFGNHSYITEKYSDKEAYLSKRTSSIGNLSDIINSQIQQLGSGVKRNWDSGLRILIVDDASINRKITGKLMRNHGHLVIEATDGLDCIRIFDEIEHRKALASKERPPVVDLRSNCNHVAHVAPEVSEQENEGQDIFKEISNSNILSKDSTNEFENFQFDMILMDDQMPRMDGHQATKIIREKYEFSGLIYALTGHLYEERVKQFLECGADEVLSKPLNIEKLQLLVKNAFSNQI